MRVGRPTFGLSFMVSDLLMSPRQPSILILGEVCKGGGGMAVDV